MLVGWFVPELKYCSWRFLIQLCTGEKYVFQTSQVPEVAIPGYKELKLKKILQNVLPHTNIERYLPDKRGSKYVIN